MMATCIQVGRLEFPVMIHMQHTLKVYNNIIHSSWLMWRDDQNNYVWLTFLFVFCATPCHWCYNIIILIHQHSATMEISEYLVGRRAMKGLLRSALTKPGVLSVTTFLTTGMLKWLAENSVSKQKVECVHVSWLLVPTGLKPCLH